MEYLYDAVTNAFYPLPLRPDYEAAGVWPESGVIVNEEVFAEFQNPPPGKIRAPDESGNPSWVNSPPPSDVQVKASNVALKSQYLKEANDQIDILTDATDPDIMGEDINPVDVTMLKLWKKYRVELSRVTDMLNPVWPTLPQ